MKSLIVYYSLTNGNTKRIAEMLQQATQADIAEIQTVTPYTGGYDAVVAQGQEEVNRGYEPEIQPLSVSVADYDRIFIGTPTWWYTSRSDIPAPAEFQRKGRDSVYDKRRMAGAYDCRYENRLSRCCICTRKRNSV